MTEETETLLEFPCSFPIKIFGRDEPGFDGLVVNLIRQHVPDLHEGAVRSRPSSKGKYLAVTVTITATSKTQIDAIYYDLTDCDAVIMAL